jgi:cytochrome c oxidase subunit 2
MRIPYTRCLGMLSVAAVLISVRPSTAAQAVHELEISASKFQFEPSTIQVTAGEPVRLVLRSMDTVHGFSIPKLKIEAWIPKGGEAVTVEFIAPAAGQYEIACSEFCGSRHGQMKAMLVSTPSTQKSR